MEQKETSHRQDVACSRCRERKTRCSKEKPVCGTCKSENSECDYSLPEKRVNHTKLLYHSVDRLEDRLSTIEGQLSWLTGLFKAGGCQQTVANSVDAESGDENSNGDDSPQPNRLSRDFIANRRITRGHDDHGDLYHGPGTLLSLCYEMRAAVLSIEGIDTITDRDGIPALASINTMEAVDSGSPFLVKERCIELLQRMCTIASVEPALAPAESASIRLPPKQLLLMALPQFLSQVDYSIDIFVPTHLSAQVERVYSRTSADDAWAICFNTIILLVFSSETWTRDNDPLMLSQFSLPLFQATRAALHQARLLTKPRLVNVQALILLSIAAERYYPAATSAAVFAQACLLAKRTGLHQGHDNTSADMSQDEAQERCKTFLSLHLRDKAHSLTLCSICWLPSFDHGLSLRVAPSVSADARIEARIELAEVQEQLYRYLSSGPRRRPSRSAGEIARICQAADSWASRHGPRAARPASKPETELQLTFLGTRMMAYSCCGADSEGHRSVVLDDARASCLVLLVSYEKHDRAMLRMLQSLRRAPSRTRSAGSSPATEQEHDHDMGRAVAMGEGEGEGEAVPSAGYMADLVGAFPPMAFFKLAHHVLWPPGAAGPSPPRAAEGTPADYELLQAVHSCVVEANGGTQSQNRAVQMERTFGTILELIRLLRHGKPPSLSLDQYPTMMSYDMTEPGSQARTPSSAVFAPGPADMPDASALFAAEAPWDLLSSQFSDAVLDKIDLDGGEGTRKRPRTWDAGLCVDDDVLASFMPALG